MEYVEKCAEVLFILAGMAGIIRGELFLWENWRIEDEMMEGLVELKGLETDQMIDPEDTERGLERGEKKKVLLLAVRSLCMFGMLCMVSRTNVGKCIAVFILGIFMYCSGKRRLERNRKEWKEMTE